MELLIFLISYLISAVIVGVLAKRKNRNGWAWGFIGGIFLIPVLLVLMFMPYLCKLCRQSVSNKEWKNRSCPRCGDISLHKIEQEKRKKVPSQAKRKSLPQKVTGEKNQTQRKNISKQYYNKEWNFSFVYPHDWELFWENRPQGSWTVAIAGMAKGRMRPGFIVNARQDEVLKRNSNVTTKHTEKNWKDNQAPRTPGEYIKKSKANLDKTFSGLRFLTGEEFRLSNKPATRIIYSYDTISGRMQEMCVTIFGIGMTFQITCVALEQFDRFRPTFDTIINNFKIGSDPELKIEMTTIDLSIKTNDLIPLRSLSKHNNFFSLRKQDREKFYVSDSR